MGGKTLLTLSSLFHHRRLRDFHTGERRTKTLILLLTDVSERLKKKKKKTFKMTATAGLCAAAERQTLTSCAVRQNGEQLFEHGIVGGIVEALVLGLLAQRAEHGRLREMTIGVSHQRVGAVVVIQ